MITLPSRVRCTSSAATLAVEAPSRAAREATTARTSVGDSALKRGSRRRAYSRVVSALREAASSCSVAPSTSKDRDAACRRSSCSWISLGRRCSSVRRSSAAACPAAIAASRAPLARRTRSSLSACALAASAAIWAHVSAHWAPPVPTDSSLPSQQSQTPSATRELGTRRGVSPTFGHQKLAPARWLQALVAGSSEPSGQSQ
mmetsp:Transcript_99927/g.172351  ORF Transcript_99927/g.172351 Transcript_99927/m.172351 type:complete len:202 (+) Transcript_99927:859-1464(+)